MKHTYVLGLVGLVLLASCMTPPTATGPGSVGPSAPVRTSSAPRTPSFPRPMPPAPAQGSALAALATLPIKGRAPRTGYARSAFGKAWTDDNDDPLGHNGCDTRNDVLARDLRDVMFRYGHCLVASGTLVDPYTGTMIGFVRGVGTSSLVQIDHVVPLANAWVTGAQQWTARQRQDFANDPLELIPIEGFVNDAKGDGDAATWLPPDKGFRCAYAARMVAIKLKWRLWVTHAEHDALARLLDRCGALGLPVEPGRL